MITTTTFGRPSALNAVRIRPSIVAAPAHAYVVGRPAVTESALPVVGLLTCQQSVASRVERAQVGRTHGVSTTNGFGAKGIGMATIGTARRSDAEASGVPPRGRPV